MNANVKINNSIIGKNNPVYIIAEMSANHNQDFNRAVKIIEAAKAAGADAIKLQTFTPDLHTINSSKPCFRINDKKSLWHGRTLYDLYKEAYMPWEWQPKLKKIADNLGIDLFSAPVDPTGVDFLKKMNVPAYKITSMELVDIPLVYKIGMVGKPIIMSTGVATFSEIEEAINVAESAGSGDIILLKCVSSYPADPKEMNLNTMIHMSNTFKCPVGLSDHTLGITIPIVATALGANVIEKHFTLSRADGGLDSTFSLEPNEFKSMVDNVRSAEKSLGIIKYVEESDKNREYRRSLFVVENIKKGEGFTEKNLRSIRPGCGLHSRYLEKIIGAKANKNITKGTPMSWELVENGE